MGMATGGRASISLKIGDATPLGRWRGLGLGLGFSLGLGLGFSFGLGLGFSLGLGLGFSFSFSSSSHGFHVLL